MVADGCLKKKILIKELAPTSYYQQLTFARIGAQSSETVDVVLALTMLMYMDQALAMMALDMGLNEGGIREKHTIS